LEISQVVFGEKMSDIIVPMQEESFKTWSMKHRVFDKDGNPIDGSIEEAQVRVARALTGAVAS
jgi:hypothetical protein